MHFACAVFSVQSSYKWRPTSCRPANQSLAEEEEMVCEDEEEKVEEKQKQLQELEEAYQRMVLPTPSRQLVECLVTRLQHLVSNITANPPAFNFIR